MDEDQGERALVPATGPAVNASTRRRIANSKAPRTIRAYRSDLADFEAWCAAHDRAPLPATPETVAEYMDDLATQGRMPSTITRRCSAISRAHQMAGFPSPTRTELVRDTAAGIRRGTEGDRPPSVRQARPIMVDELVTMIGALPADLRGLRDRALLLVGFAGGMRRGEIVALDVDDVVEESEGIAVTIRRSKTDQEGAGRVVGIVRGTHGPLTDPVAAVREWREAAEIEAGPLFREVDRSGRVGSTRLSDRGVVRVVKSAAARIGLDTSRISGHSLRAGLATSAAAAGAPDWAIMATTGHRSTAMVQRYVRVGSKYLRSASRYLLTL